MEKLFGKSFLKSAASFSKSMYRSVYVTTVGMLMLQLDECSSKHSLKERLSSTSVRVSLLDKLREP